MLTLNNLYCFGWNTAPHAWQKGFQEPATTIMSGIIDLHHDVMGVLAFILGFVSILLFTALFLFRERPVTEYSSWLARIRQMYRQQYNAGLGITSNMLLETIWTLIPALVLVSMSSPAFALVYALEEVAAPTVTVRVTGRQWYWNYEFPDGLKTAKYTRAGAPKGTGDFLRKSSNEILHLFAARLGLTLPRMWYSFNLSETTPPQHYVEWCGEHIYPFPFPRQKLYIEFDMENTPEFVWLMDATRDRFQWDKMAKMVFNRMPGGIGPDWRPLINDRRTTCTIRRDYAPLRFNSYMVPMDDLPVGSFRLLEVDKRLVLPVNTNIRLIVTSDDVLHSWAVPSLGLKVDAVPGRTNEYVFKINKCGVYYGQCSEICGVSHGFMPVKLEVTSVWKWACWYTGALAEEWDEDCGLRPIVCCLVDDASFFTIVDEFIPFLCDHHGYSPIELHRKVVLAYMEGGRATPLFMNFRHMTASMIWGMFYCGLPVERDGIYSTLKPKDDHTWEEGVRRYLENIDCPLDFGSVQALKWLGVFRAMNISDALVERYRRQDWGKYPVWTRRFRPTDYKS
jgi:heme/copper-type cytochrome/quinol oxidase subunit 2